MIVKMLILKSLRIIMRLGLEFMKRFMVFPISTISIRLKSCSSITVNLRKTH